jgi:hypothetical protein
MSRECVENLVTAGKPQEGRRDVQGAYKRKGILQQSPSLEDVWIKDTVYMESKINLDDLLLGKGEASDPLCIEFEPSPQPSRSRRVRIVCQGLKRYLEIQHDL